MYNETTSVPRSSEGIQLEYGWVITNKGWEILCQIMRENQ